MVAVDEVVDAETDTHGRGQGQNAHCEDESKPMDTMSGADTPEDQTKRHTNEANHEWPQPVLSFHDALVPASQTDGQPVRTLAGKDTSDRDANAARQIAQTDHASPEVIWWATEDNRSGRIQDVEPDEV